MQFQRTIQNKILQCCVVALCLVFTPSWAQEEQLKKIQAQIEATQKQKEAREARRTELFAVLKKQEKRISKLAKEVNQTNVAILKNKTQIETFQREILELTASLQQQRKLLSQQIRAAYVAGDYDLAKVIFNQEDVAELERMLTYYQFIYRDRKTAIEQFREGIERIKNVEAALVEEQEKTMRLLARLEEQSINLTSEQFARQKSLDALDDQIQSDAARITQLRQDEQRLARAITEAETLKVRNTKLPGLQKLKGSLDVPADGRLQYLFGKRRQGQLKWKGVVVNGDSGSNIRSVATGKVLFADWLRGFGLVMVIDHGEGFMTVYGHNQALLKSVGDLVNRNEIVALMGQSGGQSAPNLYFELRHKGIPINPKGWLQR